LEVLLKMNRPDFSELVAALKGGASKDARFQLAKPGNFNGARDRKVVYAWLAEMDDYLHAAKVGRHSAVKLAQSYLKGYAATWWRTMKQGLMSFIVVYKQTHRNACIFECVMHSVRRAPKSRGETHLRVSQSQVAES